jgi:crotonobetainyl-CoA:carnitine CoA-transferase CaiB-like acyl-CoA transferase
MVVDLDHPRHGRVHTLGTPIKFYPPRPFAPAPPAQLGQHTDETLRALLGYAPDRIAALKAGGAIR